MEILRTIRRGTFTAVVVRGLPWQLDWSEGPLKPTEEVLVLSGDSIYEKDEGDFESGLHQVDNGEKPVSSFLSSDDLLLEFPLSEGKLYGRSEETAPRPDHMYAWYVSGLVQKSLTNVLGVSSSTRACYEIEYVTNPDSTRIEFAPGVGITTFSYHHNGTVSDVDLVLSEFHLVSAQ